MKPLQKSSGAPKKALQASFEKLKESLTSVKDLANKTWHLHRISPLYQFSFSPEALRQYSKELALYITEAVGLTADQQHLVQCSFIPLEAAGTVLERPFVAIFVHVLKSPTVTTATSAILVLSSVSAIWVGVRRGPDFATYPLLLVKGPTSLYQHATEWLMYRFDCHICKYYIKAEYMMNMIGSWVQVLGLEGNPKPFELTYTLPAEVEGMKSITLVLESDAVYRLLQAIFKVHPSVQEEALGGLILEGIADHFFYHFRTHLSACTLTRLGTPFAYLSADGRIKILSEQHISDVLSHATRYALP